MNYLNLLYIVYVAEFQVDMEIVFKEYGYVRKTVKDGHVPNVGETVIIKYNSKDKPITYKVVERSMEIGHLYGGMWVPDDVIWYIDIKKSEDAHNID